ncbi:MAG: hypothetical protein JST62_07360 [Bacteroidetes bacterium]|nr:hypothetical protein [Bacteroidota bacterium]
MRKLVLGLLLTAGICGNAMANQGKISPLQKENKQKIILLKNTISPGGPGLTLTFDCIIETLLIFRDSTGQEYKRVIEYTAGKGNECNGAVNGIRKITQDVNVVGTGVFTTN